MNSLRTLALICSTLTMGFVAGAYLLYAHTIMPGLANTDDRTFDTSYSAMDKAIVNPVFMLTAFLGAAVFTAVAVVLTFRQPTFVWAAVALVLYLVTVVITFAIHLPLNDGLAKAVASPGFDAASAREAFDVTKWVAWHYVRVAGAAAAFGCLTWALVAHGRTLP